MKTFYESIPSELRAVDAVCAEARSMLLANGREAQVFPVDLLLREFLNNAIIHGNKLDSLKRVRVGFKCWSEWVVIVIQDEGSGFDWRGRSGRIPGKDAESGRGLAIGALFARHVRYARKGTRITLWISPGVEEGDETKTSGP